MPVNLDFNNYLFKDREEAGIKLLEILPKEMIQKEDWLLLCMSYGSVPIVEMIANELNVDYDLIFVKPIFAPNNDECQIAMVSESEEIVIHHNLVDSFGISLDYVYAEAQRKYQDTILDCLYKYRKSLPLSDVMNRKVLLIDEGCETGFSTACALKSVIMLGVKKVSLATPIIADDLYYNLDVKVDKIYTNNRIKDFIEVKYYYEFLEDLKSKKVKKILEESSRFLPFKRSNI